MQDHSEGTRRSAYIKSKIFHDPIHDDMEFPQEIVSFIDTPQFQRLRNIRQLGTSYYVFPGASHNRFEHSLGVCYLAGKQIDHFRTQQPHIHISEREKTCVMLAGLLHDLGHGILSHVFDGEFMPKARPTLKWKHEEWSQAMVNRLIEQNHINIEKPEVDLINKLIDGTKPKTGMENRFIFDIVSNKTNSIDVDKFDYIARDTRNVGVVGYDVSRLMNNSRILGSEIGYAYKQPEEIIDFFATRYRLHRRIYGHRAAKAIEFMHVDALLAADNVYGISESVISGDWEQFETFDDTIFNDIRRRGRTDERLKAAREILLRIDRRELYRFVDEYLIPTNLREHVTEKSGIITPRHIVGHMEASAGLKEEDIIIQFHRLAYHPLGDEVNPLKRVKFYAKYAPDQTHDIQPEAISNLMPEVFGEVKVRCFCRKNSLQAVHISQKAFRKHMEDLNKKFDKELLARMPGPFAPSQPHVLDAMDEDGEEDHAGTPHMGGVLAYTPTRPLSTQFNTVNHGSAGRNLPARTLFGSVSAPAGAGDDNNPFVSDPSSTPTRDGRTDSPGKRLTCNAALTVPEDAYKVKDEATPTKKKRKTMV
ncbi:HD-domain/PDEase-like protein [Gonapodya prolifera JEL478]|uniref:HD-domain/PDEase-like protein n=1 Tax=Gonapodya prolifera (strain JEL478) TaxID=1344416 RepID=A0A139A4K3_GONPJ|nr:HD-domain/PDEase-like protein [Gonapodya prolifera JEL478]|eukprot:KXS11599.1 HD-domain/PDEase-like protein [Gonapodya prolifera JEL478]